jgi:hypothetical protein
LSLIKVIKKSRKIKKKITDNFNKIEAHQRPKNKKSFKEYIKSFLKNSNYEIDETIEKMIIKNLIGFVDENIKYNLT